MPAHVFAHIPLKGQQSEAEVYAGRAVGHAQVLHNATNVGFHDSFSRVFSVTNGVAVRGSATAWPVLALIFKQSFNIGVHKVIPTRRRRARMPGRPAVAAEEDVRSALLDAAGKLFLKHGFERVTARQIAAAAGTTPAMIHYYFTNKLGLFRAMLDRAITPLRERLAALPQADDSLDVSTLITMHMRMVAANSWIPVFILNEVLVEKGRFRASFLREVASRQLPLVIELLERGRASGRFRPELNPRLAALSLLSLCMFPFLTKAVSAPALGLKYEGEELDQLIDHTSRLFLRGIENKAMESHA